MKEQTNGERFDEFMKPLMNNQNFEQFSLYEHKETITSANTITTSQTGVSDEEIEQAAKEYHRNNGVYYGQVKTFIDAIKWYREQLKKK